MALFRPSLEEAAPLSAVLDDCVSVRGVSVFWRGSLYALQGAGEGADHRPGVLELDLWSPGQKCNVLVRFPYTEKSFAVGHVPSLVEVP
ncbi:MAG TPA: hypothetical protein DC031_15870 [Sulfitobacter sp.]|nr:hypothetical protein [Sulfitobacter sp.]